MRLLGTPEHCSRWFEQESDLLQSYQQKAQQLLQLSKLWQHHIDAGLAANSAVANFQAMTLVIEVTNANWGNRLHYHIPDLLAQLQTDPLLQGLQKISWYIRPQNDYVVHEPLPRKKSSLSLVTQELLHAVANTVPHADLKIALRNLARVAR